MCLFIHEQVHIYMAMCIHIKPDCRHCCLICARSATVISVGVVPVASRVK